MDDGDRQGETLADSERQSLRQIIQIVFQLEPFGQLSHTPGDLLRLEVEEARMQLQVLPHREFTIEGERLGHEADTLACLHILGVHRPVEQPGVSFRCGQQAGEHLHGRGLAAAVRAEKTENFSPLDAKAHMIDCRKTAEPHREAMRFDGRRALVCPARRDRDGAVASTFLFGEQ